MSADSGKQGFTLVEVSIVLLIIALITGGIIIGQTMIRQTQVMSVIVDEQKYVKAAIAFRDKYSALPGDMVNATSYWGTNTTGAGCPPTTSYSAPQTPTCNGNGNGLIESDGTGASNTPDQKYENFYAWQQLADAGFIQGSYTGAPGASGGTDNEPSQNVPGTKIPNGGFEWMAFNASSPYSASEFSNIIYYQQYLLLGAKSTSDLIGSLLTPAEASTIDSKIDDGLPATGIVTTFSSGSCVSSTNINTSTYLNTDKSYQCILLFQVNW